MDFDTHERVVDTSFMRILRRIAVLCLFPGMNPVLQADEQWRAGLSRVVITPGELGWMAGYAARRAPAEKVLQDLHTKCLAVEDTNGTKLVIVTLDLIGVPKSLRTDIEAYVVKTHRLKPGQLLLNASHTHSGPAIRLFRPDGGKGDFRIGYDNVPEEDQPMRTRQVQRYNEMLRKKIQESIDQSIKNLSPAKLSWSRAKCGFAMNRRTPVTRGSGGVSYKNSPNPDGPVDHEVPVLQIRDTENRLVGVLFGYACHATTLGTLEMHGDWPGFAQQYFEELHPGTVAMFLNGCSGDQNPYPRRMVPFMHRHGQSMAMAIEAALRTRQKPVVGPLQSELARPEIAYSKAPTREELAKRIKANSGYEKRYAEFLLSELDACGSLPVSYPVPVQVVRFGDSLTIAAIGGEVTIDYSLRLKKELSQKTLGAIWVAGYSNDVMTYIPSKRVLKEGGYEGRSSMIYSRAAVHPAPWAPEIEETLVGKVHELFDNLKPGKIRNQLDAR